MARKKKFRDVRVRDFLPDHPILGRTVSNYHWGIVYGIDTQGRSGVERADGKIFLFDVNKGKSQKPNESPQLFCKDAHYRRLFESAGLTVLDVHSPLATGKEATQWISETTTAAWTMHVVCKNVAS